MTASSSSALSIILICVASVIVTITRLHVVYMREHLGQTSRNFQVAIPHHDTKYKTELDTELEDCLSINSERWLNGTRLGNSQDPSMNQDFIDDMILRLPSLVSDISAPSTLLNQTLCHKDSRFRSLANSTDVHFWSLRLLYMAIHIHQHIPALPEAKRRRHLVATCQSELESRSIGPFDFECPSTKFLVVSMGRLGLGAVMRLGVVNALVAGIATNRTVLFVNNSPVGPKFLREPWLMSSCPRRDMQCFYMPITPCTLTTEDLTNAGALSRIDRRTLFRDGTLPADLEDQRVVLLDVVLRPQRTPPQFRQNAVQIIRRNILDRLPSSTDQSLRPLLQQATESILKEEEPIDGSYYYFGHNNKHNHAFIFYAMRPNFEYSIKLENIMQETIPKELNPEATFGLPIRASDKCDLESECLPFHQYMDMTHDSWKKYKHQLPSKVDQEMPENVIVTSEAYAIHEALLDYQQSPDKFDTAPLPTRFVTNSYDAHPNTGNPDQLNTNITADEVMLSAISSLQTQLHARFTIGNCCSNFHLLLFDFLRDGCGAATDQVAECMQDNTNPSFRLCCSWSKTEECNAKRNRTSIAR